MKNSNSMIWVAFGAVVLLLIYRFRKQLLGIDDGSTTTTTGTTTPVSNSPVVKTPTTDPVTISPVSLSDFNSFKTSTAEDLAKLQKILTAGEGIDIDVNGVISAKGTGIATTGTTHTVLAKADVVDLQAMIDNIPSRGASIILAPGDYIITDATSNLLMQNKSNVIIDGLGLANFINASVNKATFIPVGVINSLRLTGINWSSNQSTSVRHLYALFQTLYSSKINGLEIDSCKWTAPNAAQNMLTFTPYSPSNENGIGQGSNLWNVNIHDNTGVNIGGPFCELTAHVWADDKSDVYAKNFKFINNTLANLGTKWKAFAPAVSLSGLVVGVECSGNNVEDAQFTGLEFVGCRNVSCSDNNFSVSDAAEADPTRGSTGYSFSGGGGPNNDRFYCEDVSIKGGGGQTRYNSLNIYTTRRFSVMGGAFKSRSASEIRGQFGELNGVQLTVTTGTQGGGGTVLKLDGTNGIKVRGGTYSLTNAQQTNYSCVNLIGSAANNPNVLVEGVTMVRPNGSLDSHVHTDGGGTNVKLVNNLELTT